jgi:hypothetical protein
MISPEEIKQQALKWWKPFLQSAIYNTAFFPKSIDRIGKIQSSDITHRFEALRGELEILYKYSKNQTGIGYLIKMAGRNFRRIGAHELPENIEFETIDDYLHGVGKQKEWKTFIRNYELLRTHLPLLEEWIVDNPLYDSYQYPSILNL